MTRPKFYGKDMEELQQERDKMETRVSFLTASLAVTRRQRDELEAERDGILWSLRHVFPPAHPDCAACEEIGRNLKEWGKEKP